MHKNSIATFVSVNGAAFHPFRELLLGVVASKSKALSSAGCEKILYNRYYSIETEEETGSVTITNVTIAINNTSIMLRHF